MHDLTREQLLEVAGLVGLKITIGTLELTIAQVLSGPHGNVLDIVATTDGDEIFLEHCPTESGEDHGGRDLDDPDLIFAVLLIHGCAGWFCPECRMLVESSPREAFHPKAVINGF